jgi:4-hydroxy-tetrahydrodipicolinate synthase
MTAKWAGVFPALTTPFTPTQDLDLPAMCRQIDTQITAGVQGLILLGSLGENTALEPDEKRLVLTTALHHVAGRVPVLSGVAETSTRVASRYAADLARLGVQGLMVLPAMVYKADAREAMSHFRAVAAASPLPIMIYNNPVAYSVDLLPEHFAELADEPKFVAIKESSDNIRRFTDLRNCVGDRYALFGGVDDLALEAALLGADGWVAGVGNAFPVENQRLWNLTQAGHWDAARTLYRWYTPLLHLDVHVKLVQYIKLAMQEVGLGSETVRAPRLPITGAERERVLHIIRHGVATRPK